ncbi:MAG: hypothetical protein IKE43_09480 [Coriobacteriales bacterium]|nr:hypothetical protein [Coriobacteriales bacterium]
MGLNKADVYAPRPAQSSVSGAIAVAPVGTTMPTDAKSALANTFDDGGYVGDAGITLGLNRNTNVIRDWSQGVVRTLLNSFDGTVVVPIIQIDEWSAKRLIGDDNVVVTAATTTASGQIKMKIGSQLPDPEEWVFSMKDGDRRVRVILPDACITAIDNVAFVPNAVNNWNATLTCSEDADGYSIYVIYDNGEVLSA